MRTRTHVRYTSEMHAYAYIYIWTKIVRLKKDHVDAGQSRNRCLHRPKIVVLMCVMSALLRVLFAPWAFLFVNVLLAPFWRALWQWLNAWSIIFDFTIKMHPQTLPTYSQSLSHSLGNINYFHPFFGIVRDRQFDWTYPHNLRGPFESLQYDTSGNGSCYTR